MATVDRRRHPPAALREAPEAPPQEEVDLPEAGAPDVLESETGLDLSAASPLDADHVLADEESARIVQAPD